jgi:hypothetical protein
MATLQQYHVSGVQASTQQQEGQGNATNQGPRNAEMRLQVARVHFILINAA